MQDRTPPRGTFEGQNFMTPTILGNFEVAPETWAELSEGRGMRGQPIFGVTVRRSGGARLSPDPSKLCQSKREAEDYILTLTSGDGPLSSQETPNA